MIASYPDRRFQLWKYNVSHSHLLIRSHRSLEEGGDRQDIVDLVFPGVDYMNLKSNFNGLEIVDADEAEIAAAESVVELLRTSKVYALVSEGQRHLIVAAMCRVVEHESGIFDPTPGADFV